MCGCERLQAIIGEVQDIPFGKWATENYGEGVLPGLQPSKEGERSCQYSVKKSMGLGKKLDAHRVPAAIENQYYW